MQNGMEFEADYFEKNIHVLMPASCGGEKGVISSRECVPCPPTEFAMKLPKYLPTSVPTDLHI